jgi:hypothetical protein
LVLAGGASAQLPAPVAFWHFDEASGSTVAADASGNGNNGSVVGLNTTACWVAGKVNGAIQFDNMDLHHVVVADSPSISFGDASFSISLLMKAAGDPGFNETMIIKGSHALGNALPGGGTGSGKRYIVYGHSTGRLNFDIDDDFDKSEPNVPVATKNVFDNEWHHVVAVRDRTADNMRIYIDGVLLATATDNTETPIEEDTPLFMGDAPDQAAENSYGGALDEVQIFNVVLTDQQIADLADSYGLTTPPPPPPPPAAYDFSLSATHDAHVANDSNAGATSYNSNFNGVGAIQVRNIDAPRRRVGFFRYDTSTLTDDVRDAYLQFTMGNVGNGLQLFLHGVLEPYDEIDETTLNWNNAPGLQTAPSPLAIDAPLDENAYVPSELTGVLTTFTGAANNQATSTALSAALDDFINSDTDGIVTFMVRAGYGASVDGALLDRREDVSSGGTVLRGNLAAAKRVAFIVEDPDNLGNYGLDLAIWERLTTGTGGLGFVVDLVDSDDVDTAKVAELATSVGLIIVSESIDSVDVDELAGVAVPMLHFEGFGWDNIDFGVGAGQWLYNQTQIAIIDDTHPVIDGAGLSNGAIDVHTTPTQIISKLIADLAPGVEVLATGAPGAQQSNEAATETVEGSNYATVWALDLGAPLETTGQFAAARRVGMFFNGATAAVRDADEVTDDAWAIFDSAIEWLCEEVTPNRIDEWMLY